VNWKDVERTHREGVLHILMAHHDVVVKLIKDAEKHAFLARRDQLVDDLLAVTAAIERLKDVP